ncbi:adenine phosphoribosyltransferase [Parvularcula sp. IMCC14364]|uniref:adenine phosphoribosyltransferase n=1 Tax=Parvularcula sp. IMCC14364 TaxID=3067902 RepID=UPI002740C5CE|nr:adenine phosphoribosyltransferase [Parvularcula sp. IMCC14364]
MSFDLKTAIRTIPDFPKEGIMFRDVTTLMGNPEAFVESVKQLSAPFRDSGIDKVAGIEARGFIFGSVVAAQLGAGFIPLRKKGKLPAATVSETYELEYGSDELEMHVDALEPGEKVLIIDDLIATGGTAEASIHLLTKAGAEIVAAAFVVDLPDLNGIERIHALGIETHCLVAYDGH